MLTLHKPNRLQTGKCMCIDVNKLVEIKHSTNIKTAYLRRNVTCSFMNRNSEQEVKLCQKVTNVVFRLCVRCCFPKALHRPSAPFRCTVHCTEFGALVHRI